MGVDYAQGYGVSEPKHVSNVAAYTDAPGEL